METLPDGGSKRSRRETRRMPFDEAGPSKISYFCEEGFVGSNVVALLYGREALTSDKKKVGMVERRLMIEKEKIQGLKKELQSGQSVEKIDAEIKRINDERFKWATQQATIVKDLNTGAVKQSEILMEKIIAMRGKVRIN
jgi:hypothetical protein